MESDTITEPWIDDSITNIQSVGESIHRVYWTAFWANLGLACFKIIVGALGYSRLLIIDGMNSGAIAVAITIIMLGIHMSHPQTVSDKYPSGMGKAQYIIILIAGVFLTVGASLVLVISIKSFFNPVSLEPVDIGISVALISIMGNLMLLYYLKNTGSFYEKEKIKTIVHLQFLNIGSSFVVLNSLLFSGLFGWYIAEHLGSISISFIVIWLSIYIIKHSLDGIMDRSRGNEIESRLTEIAYSVDEVKEVKFLRTRRSGYVLLIDFQICLDGTSTIRQSDKIVSQIKKRMADDLKGTSHIITIDPCPA